MGFLINDLSHIGWNDPFGFEPKDPKAAKNAQALKEMNKFDKIILKNMPDE